jgi:hypothetical protein
MDLKGNMNIWPDMAEYHLSSANVMFLIQYGGTSLLLYVSRPLKFLQRSCIFNILMIISPELIIQEIYQKKFKCKLTSPVIEETYMFLDRLGVTLKRVMLIITPADNFDKCESIYRLRTLWN